jgi:hypothetical protein
MDTKSQQTPANEGRSPDVGSGGGFDISDPHVAYNEKWDSYYDTRTGEWLERVCDDEDCNYCIGRPPKAPLSNPDDEPRRT